MPKMIVTHKNPDLDAIVSAWLLVRFDQPRYGDAALAFVPAGGTYKGEPVDSDENITHVDVGMGRFDHHQKGVEGTCASKLVWHHLVEQGLVSPSDTALIAMVDHSLAIDVFADVSWPESQEDRFAFTLSETIPAIHRLQLYDNEAVLRAAFLYLDGVYQRLKDVQQAKEAIAGGQTFTSAWGRSLAVATGADDISKVAQKMGYELVAIQDPQKGYLKIKLRPGAKRNLASLYDRIVALESPQKWFFHNSGLMLFNGSDKGAPKEPSILTLEDLITLIKEV